MKTEYAKEQEEKHKRKIVLPSVIPWEYGSNKYASQKGQNAFGRIRNTTIKIESTKELSNGDNSSVPFHSCPTLHKNLATQSGDKPFGSFRSQITKVKENDELKKINEILVDPKATERILIKWGKSNPNAKNDGLYGKIRNTVSESVGGRRFTQEELNKSRASLPRFQDFKETSAGKDYKIGSNLSQGYQANRQATMNIQGLNFDKQNQLDSNRYMAWLGGQITLQSQSKTGGFNKPRDVVNSSYYDKIMKSKKDNFTPQQLFELKKENNKNSVRTMTVGEAIKESDSCNSSFEIE